MHMLVPPSAFMTTRQNLRLRAVKHGNWCKLSLRSQVRTRRFHGPSSSMNRLLLWHVKGEVARGNRAEAVRGWLVASCDLALLCSLPSLSPEAGFNTLIECSMRIHLAVCHPCSSFPNKKQKSSICSHGQKVLETAVTTIIKAMINDGTR